MKITIIIPFYDENIKDLKKCLKSIDKINPYEVILVDNCSKNKELINLAKKSKYLYLRTIKYYKNQNLAFNYAFEKAKGDYICKMNSLGILKYLPSNIDSSEVCFCATSNLGKFSIKSIEELILYPRDYTNGIIAKKEIFLKHKFQEDNNVDGNLIFLFELLWNKYKFSYINEINFLDLKKEKKINEIDILNIRHRNIQSIARFCQTSYIEQNIAVKFMTLAIKSFYYGKESFNYIDKAENIV